MNIVFLLAMSSPEKAVWLSFAFYLLNLLVPIIPAVIIYRLFPEGKAGRSSVQGGFGGWKIKAVGAWGAYVTAFLLGGWAINTTTSALITAVGGASVWEIVSAFQLLDENGREITATVDKLEIDPDPVKPWGNEATITVTSKTLGPPDQLKIKLDGYGFKVVDLRNVVAKDGKITLPPITMRRLPPIAPGAAPAPLREGEGPPALTANN